MWWMQWWLDYLPVKSYWCIESVHFLKCIVHKLELHFCTVCFVFVYLFVVHRPGQVMDAVVTGLLACRIILLCCICLFVELYLCDVFLHICVFFLFVFVYLLLVHRQEHVMDAVVTGLLACQIISMKEHKKATRPSKVFMGRRSLSYQTSLHHSHHCHQKCVRQNTLDYPLDQIPHHYS